MIDPCIYKIYKEDKKVIIPDFGAIIYSEATDTIDFNDVLTFDDGKVIDEIRARKKSTKKAAAKALNDHIEKVRLKLESGKPHLIRGLGYIFKTEEGAYAVQKNKPEATTGKKDKSQKNEEEENIIPIAPIIAEETGIGTHTEDVEPIEQEAINETPEEDEFEPAIMSSVDFDNSNVDAQDNYEYKPFLSDEDENVQDYYNRKDEYDQEDHKPNRMWYYIAAVILLLAVTGAGLYYFVFDGGDNLEKQEVKTVPAIENIAREKQQSDEKVSTEVGIENTSNQQLLEEPSTISEKPEPEAQSIVQETQTEASAVSNYNGKTYSLILGSFQIEDNANNFHKYLTNKQQNVSIFNWGGSFHFVGFERIDGKDEALKLLAVMREEEEPTAWISRTRQY